MKVGIASLIHESNSFISTPTTTEMFRTDALLTGAAVHESFQGGHHEVSGFLEGLAREGVEAVPVFFASTAPSGVITRETCDELMDILFDSVDRAGPVDGWLVAPHGANVGDGEVYRDLDGHWLCRLRTLVGPGVPIVCTVDAHANVSQRMIDACDATISYRTNPHLDQKQVGLQAAGLIARTLKGQVRPTQAVARPSIAINIEKQLTSSPPCRPVYDLADRILDRPGILADSVVLGFPYSDVEEMGSSAIVVTDGDAGLARATVSELEGYLYDHRADFVGEYTGVEEAVEKALSIRGPVCLLDMGDNVGGGSAADGTWIAQELHRRGGARAYVCIYDPEAATAAIQVGAGARLELSMGGKTDDLHGPPLVSQVRVRGIHDGRFQESEVRHGGRTHFDMGTTAVVETESGITVGLTSRRMFPVSLGMITSCDLDPASFQILVAKGVHAPVAAYEPVCSELIRVDTAGATAADMRRFTYQHRRRPLYPFEDI